jgi:hypothetical protein
LLFAASLGKLSPPAKHKIRAAALALLRQSRHAVPDAWYAGRRPASLIEPLLVIRELRRLAIDSRHLGWDARMANELQGVLQNLHAPLRGRDDNGLRGSAPARCPPPKKSNGRNSSSTTP